MSWLVINRQNIPFIDKVRSYHNSVQEDLSHKAVSGLRALRTVFTKSNHKKTLTFPVVFTNLSRSSRFKVPEGFKPGNSLSQTSQVHVDNMSSEENGKLYLYWDVAKELFPVGLMQEMFAGYHRVLECLADDPQSWKKTNFNHLINAQPEKYRVAVTKKDSTNLASELEIEHV
jgi:non-ribosomal peptide synthetase component F